jgi:hypothetical protein
MCADDSAANDHELSVSAHESLLGACDSRHFSNRKMLNFRYRFRPIPIRAAIDLKSPSIVTRTALFASATAATKVSGESGAVFSRNRITRYPADSNVLDTDSGTLWSAKNRISWFFIVTQLLHLCDEARLQYPSVSDLDTL